MGRIADDFRQLMNGTITVEFWTSDPDSMISCSTATNRRLWMYGALIGGSDLGARVTAYQNEIFRPTNSVGINGATLALIGAGAIVLSSFVAFGQAPGSIDPSVEVAYV